LLENRYANVLLRSLFLLRSLTVRKAQGAVLRLLMLGVVAALITACESPYGATSSADTSFHPGVDGSLTYSVVTVSPAIVSLNHQSVVTLTLYDDLGNRVSTTGQTVVFNYDGGTSVGTFTATIDNADGSYSSTFTGTAAGSPVTIHATIGGDLVTGSSPTLQVQLGIPQSLTYSPNPAVFNVGSTTSITPSNLGGTPTSYAITPAALPAGLGFNSSTGIISGTPTTVSALQTFSITASNSSGTSTAAILSLTVNPTPPATISYIPASPSYFQNQTVYLSPTTTGGTPASFAISPTTLPTGLGFNTSTGVISGTPTATMSTTAFQVTASNAGGATPAFTLSLSVTNPVPILNTVSDLVFPSSPVTVGSALSLTFQNTNTSNDVGMSYACQFNKTIGGTFSTACSTLPGTFSFTNSTGALSWTPSSSAWGSYQFQIIGTNSAGPSTAVTFVADIFQGYPTTNLVLDLVSDFATLTSFPMNNPMTTTWKNVFTTGSSYDGTLTGFPTPGLTTNGWNGAETTANPYALVFNGLGTRVNLGSSIGGNASAMLTAWVAPSNIVSTQTGGVIATNNDSGAGKGITIRQSAQFPGTYEVETVGGYAYTQEVLSVGAANLYGYWRLNENSGTTLVDSSGNSNSGAYYLNTTATAPAWSTNSPILNDSTALSASIPYPATGTAYGTASNNTAVAAPGPQTYSEEIWFKATSGYAIGGYLFSFGSSKNGLSSNHDRKIWMDNTGKINGGVYPGTTRVITSTKAYNDGFWHQAVATFTGNNTTGTFLLYVDGAQVATMSGTTVPYAQNNYAGYWRIGFDSYAGWAPVPTSGEFKGPLAEAAAYKIVLTPAQILRHYQLGVRRCQSAVVATNNQWTFLAATYDGTTTNFYVNGSLSCTMGYGTSGALNPGAANLTLGATSSGTDAWSGALGDFKAYTSGTSTDVTNIYNATSPTY
jgi:hypothetical protein